MASIEKRIEALEAAFASAQMDSSAGAREGLVDEFFTRALNAMACIKGADHNPEPYRYSVEKLRGEGPLVVTAHVAALTALEHEDEDEAREILKDLEHARGLDPAIHEKLIEAFARMTEQVRQRREAG